MSKGELKSRFDQGVHGGNQRLHEIVEKMTEADGPDNREDGSARYEGRLCFVHLILRRPLSGEKFVEVDLNVALSEPGKATSKALQLQFLRY